MKPVELHYLSNSWGNTGSPRKIFKVSVYSRTVICAGQLFAILFNYGSFPPADIAC